MVKTASCLIFRKMKKFFKKKRRNKKIEEEIKNLEGKNKFLIS